VGGHPGPKADRITDHQGDRPHGDQQQVRLQVAHGDHGDGGADQELGDQDHRGGRMQPVDA
jgi:hypothetical protein